LDLRQPPAWLRNLGAVILCLFLINFWSSGIKNALAWGTFLVVVVLHLRARGRAEGEHRIPAVSLHLPVAAYVLVALVSSLVCPERALALGDWLKLAELAAAYVALTTLLGRAEGPQSALRALAAATAAYLAVDFGRALLLLGSAWTITADPTLPTRWNSSLLGYITHAAGVTVTMMFIIASVGIASRRWWERIAALVAVLISLVMIFVAWQARSAQLGTAAGAVMLAMLLARRKSVGVAIGCAALAAIIAGLAVTGGGRWAGGGILSNDRFDLWSKTATQIAEKPILGHGVGPKVFSRWYESIPYDERVVKTPGHPHNMFVQVAYETGGLGLIAWLWIWAALYRSLWRTWRGSVGARRTMLAGLMVAFAAFLIYGQFSAALSLRPTLLFWSLLGLAGATEASRRASLTETAQAPA